MGAKKGSLAGASENPLCGQRAQGAEQEITEALLWAVSASGTGIARHCLSLENEIDRVPVLVTHGEGWLMTICAFFFLKSELIGVRLVNNVVQVSAVEFCSTFFVYYTVCLPPRVPSPSITM